MTQARLVYSLRICVRHISLFKQLPSATHLTSAFQKVSSEMAFRAPKVRAIDDPEDRSLITALRQLRVADVTRVPTPPPPPDAGFPKDEDTSGQNAGDADLGGPEADRDEFHLPFAKTVDVLDGDDPEGGARVLRLTDSDDRESDSDSNKEREGMYPSESSDGCGDGSGSGGRGSDYDF
jgi:hypothetical protein